MFARGVLSFYPPRLHASSCFPSKPFVSPTYKITVRNSFVSPTYAKTGGCTPSGPTNRISLQARPIILLLSQVWTVNCRPPSPPPFTSHSQSCYPTFTHPSPSLVTMFPSQGSYSHTMPITIRTPTVHFYRCDPPREIRS